MNIPYLQTTPYGCGMYAVAHALNLNNFVNDQRLEQSAGYGNTNGQLNTWLKEDGHDFYIEQMYYNHTGKKLPKSCFTYHVTGGDDIIGLPVLFNVRYTEGGLNHLIGGKIDRQGLLWLYDSLRPEVRVTTVSKLNSIYHNVWGMHVFMNTKGEYVFIHKN